MYNKVEICGVNTSKLTVISEEKKRELAGDTAPPQGLFLEKIIYPGDENA